MRHVLFFAIALVWAFAWSPNSVLGNEIDAALIGERSHSSLFVDHAVFRSAESDQLRLEIYLQLYHAGLLFESEGSSYMAQFVLTIRIYDDDGQKVGNKTIERTVRAKNKKRATSLRDFRVHQVNFDLPAGKYQVKVTLKDKNRYKTTDTSFKVKLENPKGDRPQFSHVEFVQVLEEAKENASPFDKGNLRLIPSVHRLIGGDRHATLLYYFEIYSDSEMGDTAYVETKLKHWTKKEIHKDTLEVALTPPVTRQIREIQLAHVPSGSYRMELKLMNFERKKKDKKKTAFSLAWTPSGMIRNDWDTVVNQLEYIADGKELKGMKDLEVDTERARAFAEFWRRWDLAPSTPENESKAIFYRRVALANRLFKTANRDGWKSDRGLIYIRYGAPDDLLNQSFESDQLPYQVWEYYRTRQHMRYLFVDEHMTGDYRLINWTDDRQYEPDLLRDIR